jgi:plastocyanin
MIPGCEETNSCYIPHSLPVRVGDTVIWNNVDTAAHTVTSGSIEEGLSEIFDSSFIMPEKTFVFTFDEAGEYPYFCTLHPWMIGVVAVSEVEEMVVVSEPTVVAELEPETVEEESIEEIVLEEEIAMKEKIEKPEAEPEPETLSMILTVLIPEGVGVPGCEETKECYLPYEVSVAVGTTVNWSNGDTAVHTVTSGNPTGGVDELFDSSIFMSGDTFEFTFNDAGTFDYFCVVHPWMAGIVNVS